MAEPTYYTSVINSAVAANKRHLVLFNGVGSGVLMKVYRIRATGAPQVAVAGLVVALGCFRVTSAPTGGTPGTFNKADTLDPDVPALVTATLTATGGAAQEPNVFGGGTVSSEETQAGGSISLYEAPIDGTKPEICREGEGIVVVQGGLASAGAVHIIATVSLV